jgi:hypothetical protein
MQNNVLNNEFKMRSKLLNKYVIAYRIKMPPNSVQARSNALCGMK